MQAGKAKSFQIYFSFFFVSALDKSSYGYFSVKQLCFETGLSFRPRLTGPSPPF